VAEAAKGSGDIARNITTVTQVAQNTSAGAGQTQTAATELARMAAELRQLVSKYSFEADTSRRGRAPAGKANGVAVRKPAAARLLAHA
jgi:methyl-accepting chemotaxis protein